MVTHMKTTVEIADAVLREAKEVAARESVTFRELVEEGLALVVQRRQARREFRLREAHVAGRGLQPGMSWELPRDLAYDDGGLER